MHGEDDADSRTCTARMTHAEGYALPLECARRGTLDNSGVEGGCKCAGAVRVL